MCLQFGFVIFWRKEIGAKTAGKMLLKLNHREGVHYFVPIAHDRMTVLEVHPDRHMLPLIKYLQNAKAKNAKAKNKN